MEPKVYSRKTLLPLLLLLIWCSLEAWSAGKDFYKAAVYEHNRFGNLTDPPELVVETNLKYYKIAAEVARSKGADIIVYPEYGTYFPGDRKQMKTYLEVIPDPRVILSNPCNEVEMYINRPTLHALSCMAKNNSMFVVANMGEIQNCEKLPSCPSDGVFHFNTNVVFDRNGTLVLKYSKEHLFFELGMNIPNEVQNSTFKTDFGTFATYICFDIDWYRMNEVARRPDVDGVAFTAMWFVIPPLKSSPQMFESWAIGNDATILASSVNLQIYGYFALGSGIYHGRKGALAYTFNPDKISKLVVAKVPKKGYEDSVPEESSITAITEEGTWDYTEDGKDVPERCTKTLNETEHLSTEFRCLTQDTSKHTLVKLTEPSGVVTACNNGMCCSVNYSSTHLEDDFFLGVFNGTRNFYDRYFWCEESCFLARCDPSSIRACEYFPIRSHTTFKHIQLSANFTTDFVFPSVAGSAMRVVPRDLWHYQKQPGSPAMVDFEDQNGRDVLAVGLRGRCYQKDPP